MGGGALDTAKIYQYNKTVGIGRKAVDLSGSRPADKASPSKSERKIMMKFADCLAKIDNSKDWDVRFYEEKPMFGPIIRMVTDRLVALLHEWGSSGRNIPATDKQVYGIMFANRLDGRTYLVDDSEVMTFSQLMQALYDRVHQQDA